MLTLFFCIPNRCNQLQPWILPPHWHVRLWPRPLGAHVAHQLWRCDCGRVPNALRGGGGHSPQPGGHAGGREPGEEASHHCGLLVQTPDNGRRSKHRSGLLGPGHRGTHLGVHYLRTHQRTHTRKGERGELSGLLFLNNSFKTPTN